MRSVLWPTAAKSLVVCCVPAVKPARKPLPCMPKTKQGLCTRNWRTSAFLEGSGAPAYLNGEHHRRSAGQ